MSNTVEEMKKILDEEGVDVKQLFLAVNDLQIKKNKAVLWRDMRSQEHIPQKVKDDAQALCDKLDEYISAVFQHHHNRGVDLNQVFLSYSK